MPNKLSFFCEPTFCQYESALTNHHFRSRTKPTRATTMSDDVPKKTS